MPVLAMVLLFLLPCRVGLVSGWLVVKDETAAVLLVGCWATGSKQSQIIGHLN